jgi:hypothetical protein
LNLDVVAVGFLERGLDDPLLEVCDVGNLLHKRSHQRGRPQLLAAFLAG